MTFLRAVFATCFCFFALSACSFAVAEQVATVVDTSEPSFGPSPFATDGNKAATTVHPIHLFRGSVIENAKDLTLETPISTWTNKRTYRSLQKIRNTTSEVDSSEQAWIL